MKTILNRLMPYVYAVAAIFWFASLAAYLIYRLPQTTQFFFSVTSPVITVIVGVAIIHWVLEYRHLLNDSSDNSPYH